MTRQQVEVLLLRSTRGLASRFRMAVYCALGLRAGIRNRMEAVRCRRLSQIQIGDRNSFSEGCWLWPSEAQTNVAEIRIGSENYFNRGVMLDACGLIEIGNENMFGPDVYITDANHSFAAGAGPRTAPMSIGHVKIGNRCWIGAKAVILRDVELGDGCIVGAGAVVTKSFPAGSVLAGVPARVLRSQAESTR